MIATSNIRSVIERLERWQAGLPAAVAKALAPEHWVAALKVVAQQTLQAQLAQWSGALSVDEKAAGEVMGLVQNFTDSVRGQWSASVSAFSAVWSDANVNLQSVLANQELLIGTGQYALDLDQGSVERAKQAVADWVAKEKILSEQDNYDVEQATERVQRIMGLIPPTNPAAMAGWLASPERADAAQRLAARVQEFLSRTSPSARYLTPEIVNQWLAAVMLAWREYVRLHLRDRIEKELSTLTRETMK